VGRGVAGVAVLKRGGFALCVHWYRGDVETEHLTLGLAEPCACSQLADRAATLREDELLCVTPAASARS